ncbi:DUF1566 domain-containing protein [bacterium]|nr:DUF1566 domain-containing protein [bacterium]
MKNLIFILILLNTFGIFAERPVVAVLEIDNKTAGKNKLSQYDAELIADMMRDELIQSQEFIVMSKEDMESAIAQHVKKSRQLNKDKNYAIELGKQISARFIVSSHIKTDGKFFRIFAEIIDTETGKSPRSGKEKFAMDDDSKDPAIANLIRQLLGERDESLIPQKPKKSEGQIACEEARAAGSEQKWKGFLKYYADEYPECVQEATKQLEEIIFHKAEREDTIEAWQEYLDEYPMANKRHAITAEERIAKLKKNASKSTSSSYLNPKNQGSEPLPDQSGAMTEESTSEVDGMLWSPISGKRLTFKEADVYCSSLKSGGYSDWHLPTVDDLKTLVQHCPNLEPDGACRLSEDSGCLLARKCLNKNKCRCSGSGKYSKLNDAVAIWSASLNSSDSQEAYFFDFGSGKIEVQYTGAKAFVRCTR